jgi:UDP-N-acetyl-D-galactosamine dehydrogenase
MTNDFFSKLESKTATIGVVGLGYVGLPLACLLAKKFKIVGFDINTRRISELKDGVDRTREVESRSDLLNPNLSYSSSPESLSECALIIVAVPTPVDKFNVPDLTPVVSASKTVGKIMKKGAVIVFESTVYPGITEDVCGMHLEEESGLKFGEDFYLGYSPERVNPGDKNHTIDKIVKVVSGSTPEVAELLRKVYGSVVTAGIHVASSIKTAEASKVIENTQRDINIALINELAKIFDRIGIDTLEVLEAAGTKWNFLPFRPGLVGGHCIGVDPYYLTTLAQSLGFHPDVILAGRRINDRMGEFVAEKAISLILKGKARPQEKIQIGIFGVTFKENIPDIRNTKVVDVAESLENLGAQVHIIDPLADHDEFEEEYGRKLVKYDDIPICDAIIYAVSHDVFKKEYPLERIMEKLTDSNIVLDLKSVLDRSLAKKLGANIWRL